MPYSQFHNEVNLVFVLVGLQQLDDVWVLQLPQDLNFVLKGIFFSLQRFFVDTFDGEHFPGPFATLSQNDLREGSPAKSEIQQSLFELIADRPVKLILHSKRSQYFLEVSTRKLHLTKGNLHYMTCQRLLPQIE